MPRKCCVPACKSNYSSESEKVTVFRFPKDENLKQKWIRCIHRHNFKPNTQSVVCIHHFDPTFVIKEEKYVQPDGSEVVIPNKRLKLTDTAIPTIFPHQPKYMSTAAAPVRQSLKIRDVQKKVFADNVAQKKIERDRISTIGDIKSKLGSKIRNLQFVVTYVRDSIFFLNIKYSNGYPELTSSLHVRSDLSVQLHIASQTISEDKYSNILKNHLCDSWTKLKSMLDVLDTSGNISDTDNKLCIAIENLKEYSRNESSTNQINRLNFLIEQLKLMAKSNVHRFSQDFLIWSCTMYYSFPGAYKFLRSTDSLILPHMSYLKKICSNSAVGRSGINEAHMRYLSEKINLLKDEEKLVNILFDEIYVKPEVTYKNGKLEGMSATDVTQPATTILAVMYTSVLSKNKDVVGLFPVQNLTADYLSELIQKIIKDMTFMRFEILTLISDNNKVNKKTFDILSDGNCRSTIINKYNNKPIFILFDTVHLFKSIRNNWLNQKDCEQTLHIPSFQEPVDDDDGTIGCLTAKVCHLRSLYFKEQAQVVKLAPALNKKVLNPTGIQRQNVLLCVKLFDEKNISALRVKKDEFSNSVVGTISFMETISTWWKIVNCKTPFKGKHLRDVNCEPVYSVEDERFIFLQKFVTWLQRWNDMELKNIDKRHGKLTKQTQHALLHTTETLMLLCKFLFENYNFKYVLLGKFQTDPLEGRFGQYRQMCGASYHVSVSQVLESEKKIKVLNFLKVKSAVNGEFEIRSLFSNLNEVEFNDSTDDFINRTYEELDRHIDVINISNDEYMILIYIGGYIANSLKSKMLCKNCAESLTLDKELQIESKKEALLYLDDLDRGALKVPTDFLVEILVRMFKIFQVLISDIYEDIFLAASSQKDTLCKLSLQNCEDIYLECNCPNSEQIKTKCVSKFSNILLGNYRKKKSDLQSQSNKRKLNTYASK
jgi:hypothetical protein